MKMTEKEAAYWDDYYTKNLPKTMQGVGGVFTQSKKPSEFAGSISKEDGAAMLAAIKEAEKIDYDEW
jgi:hypothetical protein